MLRQSVASLEYVALPVSAKVNGVLVDPTTDAVSFAFLLTNAAPVSGDWKSGSWETDATLTPAVYYARCLVGPSGTVTLTAGSYTVWLRVTDSPEVPIRPVDTLVIW